MLVPAVLAVRPRRCGEAGARPPGLDSALPPTARDPGQDTPSVPASASLCGWRRSAVLSLEQFADVTPMEGLERPARKCSALAAGVLEVSYCARVVDLITLAYVPRVPGAPEVSRAFPIPKQGDRCSERLRSLPEVTQH